MSSQRESYRDSMDDIVLDCLHREVVYQDWILVKKRPETAEIFYSISSLIDSTIFPSDSHVLVISHRNDICSMFGVSTVSNGDEAAYLLTCDLYDLSPESLFSLVALRNIAALYTPLRFRDSAILEEIWADNQSNTDSIKTYIHHDLRTCPVFIRRGSGLSIRNCNDTKLRQRLLTVFGPMIADKVLFNDYKDGPIRRDELIAIDTHGYSSPFLLSCELTFEEDIERFFGSNEPYPFNEEERSFEPISNRVLDFWRGPFPSASNYPDFSKEAEDYYLGWIEFTDGAFAKKAVETHDAKSTAVPAQELVNDAPAEDIEDLNKSLVTVPKPSRAVPEKCVLPTACEDIIPWVEMHFAGSLEIMPRAARALNKSKHPNPERIAASLRLLAEGKHACYSGIDRSASHTAFENGLLDLRLRDTFTNAEQLVGRTGEAYVINYNGRRLLLDRHLASQSSGFGDPRLIRIYYTYDRRTQKIVVGYLPDHLPTLKS